MLSRQDIRNAQDTPVLHLEVPEWGGEVGIARLDGPTRFDFITYVGTLPANSFDHVLRLCLLTLVGDNGERLYDDSLEAREELSRRSDEALGRVFAAALRHNRLGDREVARAQGESEPSRSSAIA